MRNIITDLQNSDTWETQLTISITYNDFTSDSIFDSLQLMYYKCHKVNFTICNSCIVFPDWMKKKKATINPKNTDDKCFQYEATVALNYEEIK